MRPLTEFQKILDHSGIVVNAPIGALAHLGLARAYTVEGDNVKARAAYQDFLTLWKDGDPKIPILLAAKAEYSKLPWPGAPRQNRRHHLRQKETGPRKSRSVALCREKSSTWPASWKEPNYFLLADQPPKTRPNQR